MRSEHLFPWLLPVRWPQAAVSLSRRSVLLSRLPRSLVVPLHPLTLLELIPLLLEPLWIFLIWVYHLFPFWGTGGTLTDTESLKQV